MKSVIVSIVLMAVLTACGKGLTGEAALQDARVETIVTAFADAAAAHGKDVTAKVREIEITFVASIDDGGDKSGHCLTGATHKRRIEISEDDWSGLDEREHEALVFHELGHCVLDREHRDDRDADGYLVSVMSTHLMSGLQYEQRRDAYVAELFR